jgi:hypothetical protein
VEKECGCHIETVLRIRPLLKKERDDTILLEEQKNSGSNGTQVAILKDVTPFNDPAEYCFDHVLPETTSQEKMYYAVGLPIVTATMNSLTSSSSKRKTKGHLLLSMGAENSGKTYTCFGGMTIPKRRASRDGLVARLLDSLFSQASNTGGRSKGFTVQISIVQVTQPKGGQQSEPNSSQIHDLLAEPSDSSNTTVVGASPKKKKNLNVRNMAARFERAIPSPAKRRASKTPNTLVVLDAENLRPTVQSCRNISEAREVLQTGLSMSQKINGGNQMCNLYITMQPVVDRTRIGDKICVLDMCGDQAANDAMINCLQILKHNSSTVDGKSSSSRTKVKPVPFRNSKVTMMLNPLFHHSSFVNISLLLAAYPGHTDFQHKQVLLKYVDRLHNVHLGTSEISGMSRDATNQNTQSEAIGRSNPQRSGNDERALHVPSSLRRDERQHMHPSREPRNSIAPVKVVAVAQRATKRESLHNSNKGYAQAEPRRNSIAPVKVVSAAHRTTQRESLYNSRSGYPRAESDGNKKLRVEPSAPIDSDLVTKSENRRDRSSSLYHKPTERKVEPSAPAASEVHESSMNSRKLKECTVDFPGVNITSNAETQGVSVGSSLTNDHSVQTTTRQRGTNGDTGECQNSSLLEGHFVRNTKRKEEMTSPLGRSSLENSEHGTSNKLRKVNGTFQRSENKLKESNENEGTSNHFDTNFENKRQMKKLEEKLKETLKEKEALEKTCFQLKKENAELKALSRKPGRNGMQSRLSQEEEEKEFLASRQQRREAQCRIKAPIQEHLDRVNYYYNIKNQWCMTNKKHFSLTVPNHFQRAPVLDTRDKENIHLEGLKNLNKGKETLTLDESDTEKKELTNTTSTRVSTIPTRRMSPQKVAKPPPNGLSALRRLSGQVSPQKVVKPPPTGLLALRRVTGKTK